MIAQELEVSLHMAFVEARQKRHEFITVEHLLLALLENPSAQEVLKACAAKVDELKKSLTEFIEQHTPIVKAGEGEVNTQPTLGFQRVIQRAILHVQSSGKKEVTGANVLVAIYGEKDSHAVYYLHQQGVSRLDVVNFISHGIAKAAPSANKKEETEAEAAEGEQAGGALDSFTQHSLAASLRSSGSSRFCAAAVKTTRCWWAKQGWAKPPLPRAWPSVSSMVTCRKFSPKRRCIRLIWVRCWRVPNIAAISNSV
jgi:ATP-dependent Clp protease ATP-binding subunit ClpA